MALAADLVQIGINSQQSSFLGDVQSDAVSATGTTQGTGTALTNDIIRVTTATAGVNDALTLPLIATCKKTYKFIRNDSAATVNVFPGSGESINNLAANASIAITANNALIFARVSSTKWVTR